MNFRKKRHVLFQIFNFLYKMNGDLNCSAIKLVYWLLAKVK